MGTDGCGREVAPPGLVVDRVERTAELVRVFARSGVAGAACPSCGVVSRVVRSRYGRRLADLPAPDLAREGRSRPAERPGDRTERQTVGLQTGDPVSLLGREMGIS